MDDEALAALVAQADRDLPAAQQAFATLMERYRPLLRNFLARYFRALPSRWIDEDDLLSDVLERLWRVLTEGKFDPARGPFHRFAFHVAQNLAVDALRSVTRRQHAPLPEAVSGDRPDEPEIQVPSLEPDPAEQVAVSDLVQRLNEQLAQLPEGLRLIANLLLAGRSGAEIAQELGISQALVSTRKNRAFSQLRSRMKGPGQD